MWFEGHFEGFAESISTQKWNKESTAEKAYIVAEKDDFRILYVRLRNLTRTAQKFTISSILREKWARKGEFIAIFGSPDSDVWHLVCPHMIQERAILRRYVVGSGEKHRTVSENLGKIDASSIEPIYDKIQEAFRLKTVTKEFYDDYKKYFSKLRDFIYSLGIDIRNSKRFSHLFLNRLMFIYFIQKKSWIGNKKDFVNWFLQAYELSKEKNRFYEKWLNNLFFNAMNKPKDERKFIAVFPNDVCHMMQNIPYLNGGLFSRDSIDDLGIEVPDSLVFEILEDFLENYNFTITEESPFDQDIAVDPAMLGKIYESLIAEEERGKAGIFYTPRTEVDFMCRLAMYEYLSRKKVETPITIEESLVNQALNQLVDFLFTPLEEWNLSARSDFTILKKFLDTLKVVEISSEVLEDSQLGMYSAI